MSANALRVEGCRESGEGGQLLPSREQLCGGPVRLRSSRKTSSASCPENPGAALRPNGGKPPRHRSSAQR